MNPARARMALFRTALATAWLVIIAVTIHALRSDGVVGVGTFVTDFRDPWRAQINADFSVHLCLIMVWIYVREPSRRRGVVLAIPVALGSVYLLPYVFVATFGCYGRFDTLLTGPRREQPDATGVSVAQCPG